MKFTKLSLMAALAITSLYASESNLSGDTKLFYSTSDAADGDLFNKTSAMGNAAVSLDYTKEVADGISLNAGATAISTLGLEGTAVGATWVEHALKDRAWIDIANITAQIGNTTAVIGRQKLDTPLAFTETWNIVENTFDAFSFINKELPDTTLVASAVTRANGPFEFTNFQGGETDLGDGIYAFGMVSKLIPNTTAQLWYYASNTTLDKDDKVWLQADTNIAEGITIGAQYGLALADANGVDDSSVVAVKLGYDAGVADLYAAFSKADDQGANSFTNYAGYGASPLYTEAWWNFGFVSEPDAQTIAIGASTELSGLALTAQYTNVTNDSAGASGEMDEVTLTASKKIGTVDASFALINTSSDDNDIDGNTVQLYLTLPFSL
jgi:hypothetical protein